MNISCVVVLTIWFVWLNVQAAGPEVVTQRFFFASPSFNQVFVGNSRISPADGALDESASSRSF